MGYLAYIIALIIVAMKDTGGMTFDQGANLFLDTAAKVNGAIFWIVLILWIIALVVVALMALGGRNPWELFLGCGCYIAFLVMLPALQFIIWRANVGMANAYGPEGIIEPVKFWVLVALTILLGSG